MQNWDTMQTTANYVEHNNWYNNMFAANIKTEPGTISPPPQQHQQQQHSPAPSSASSSTHLENYIKQQQQFSAAMDTTNINNTSPLNTTEQQQQQQQFFDTAGMHQQLMQQQQYQQHFQQAQQAAAQNQVTSHLPLGFNPLTPPGLPNAVLPAMTHFYQQSTQRLQQQTPSPQPLGSILTESEKSALTPRRTPPMDITPPKSPKASLSDSLQMDKQDQDLMSNSSEDLKYIVDSDDDQTITLPIYNSHGKMKNYKCKSCGLVAITKLAFWEHTRQHMKPEKILQCPKCPFVTELKHHLEYHIRKHKNLKPFQCDKCSYSCVNKSMLNSHRKSHSSVYQYRCADCDYATKYCHSFKLHLRKYDHKPGMVLDEEGIPNPSVVIDVYGTRRGPKNKGSGSGNLKKSHTDLKMAPTSQLSAALQGFPMNAQMPASPAKSNSSVVSELPALTLNMSLQNPQNQHQQQQQPQQISSSPQISPSPQQAQNSSQNTNNNMPNLLPPLASLLQQNRNMAFFPYWNLNLQMLAAQQQAAVLAQLSPRMREQLQKQQEQQQQQQQENDQINELNEEDEEEEEHNEDDEEFDRKSVDSAMDLSQGTPTKEEQQQTPELAMNLKLAEEQSETPLYSSLSASRRKGRVLKLDQEQMKTINLTSAPSSPQALNPTDITTQSSPINNASNLPLTAKVEEPSSADESMETGQATNNNPTTANTSASSTASSSGNSSNSSSTANSTTSAASSPSPTMYECKYCDIFFKDAVLYTIHMGYHSCDDVFKCNMCGEKCDGPVGLFVHMARNAHS